MKCGIIYFHRGKRFSLFSKLGFPNFYNIISVAEETKTPQHLNRVLSNLCLAEKLRDLAAGDFFHGIPEAVDL